MASFSDRLPINKLVGVSDTAGEAGASLHLKISFQALARPGIAKDRLAVSRLDPSLSLSDAQLHLEIESKPSFLIRPGENGSCDPG